MSNTKRNFLKAGTIIGLVSVAMMIIASLICFTSASFITEDMVLETYSDETVYTKVELTDGDYVIRYLEDGQILEITRAEISYVVDFAKGLLIAGGCYFVVGALAMLILSILVLVKTCKNKIGKGLIIALLVISALTTSYLTTAFMIVALCLKDRKVSLDNVMNIAEENNNTKDN